MSHPIIYSWIVDDDRDPDSDAVPFDFRKVRFACDLGSVTTERFSKPVRGRVAYAVGNGPKHSYNDLDPSCHCPIETIVSLPRYATTADVLYWLVSDPRASKRR